MIDNIINICSKIKEKAKCINCGGQNEVDTCIYCGTKNKELTKLIDELNFLINKLSKQIDITNIITVNNLFNSLYSIEQFNISFVNNLLLEVKYQNIVNEYIETILEKGNTKQYLNNQDYNFLYFFLINDKIKEDIKLRIINILIYNIINNNFKLDERSLEELIKIFTKEIIIQIIGIKNPYCKIVDIKSEKIYGAAICSNAYISKQAIEEFQEGKITYLLRTIFHEIIHIRQYKRSKDLNISIYDLILLKDKILSDTSRKYYNDNYYFLSIENQAFLNEIKEVIDYMQLLGIKPSNEELEELKRSFTFYKKLYGVSTRIWNDKQSDLYTLFDEYIKSNSDVLVKYPQLRLEYIEENDIIRRKTEEEIKSEYQEYKDGKLNLNGTFEEIEQYFDSILNQAKKVKISKKSKKM